MTGLAGAACPDCRRVVAPPRARCPGCGAGTEPATLDPAGELLTWTVVRSPPEGWEPGRVVGVVGLERGARVMALGPPEDEVPPVGAEVVVEDGGDGPPRFRAADASG